MAETPKRPAMTQPLALIVKAFPAAAQTSMPSAAGLAEQNTINHQIIPVIVRYLVDDCRFLLGVARPAVNVATILFRVRVEADTSNEIKTNNEINNCKTFRRHRWS